jgi:hypothetical protein
VSMPPESAYFLTFLAVLLASLSAHTRDIQPYFTTKWA